MQLAIILGLVHAAVDAATVTAIYRVMDFDPSVTVTFAWVVVYDLLAFGLQPVIGFLQDRRLSPRIGMGCGLGLSAVAVVVASGPTGTTGVTIAVVVLAGLGNAAFHLGAGAQVLSQGLETVTPIGLLVAPGALGLALGVWFGRTPTAGPTWVALMPVAIGAYLVARSAGRAPARGGFGDPLHVATALSGRLSSERPMTRARPDERLGERLGERPPSDLAVAVVGLLLVSVAVRSLVGGAATRGYDAGPWLAVGVPTVAVAGKALGGVLADRLGWVRTTVTALCVSCAFLVFVAPHPAVLLLGLLIFQLTMPVTLVTVARMTRDHLATGFGLTCLALVAGALPTIFPWGHVLVTRPVLGVWVLVSAGVTWVGLTGAGLAWRRSPPAAAFEGARSTGPAGRGDAAAPTGALHDGAVHDGAVRDGARP